MSKIKIKRANKNLMSWFCSSDRERRIRKNVMSVINSDSTSMKRKSDGLVEEFYMIYTLKHITSLRFSTLNHVMLSKLYYVLQ